MIAGPRATAPAPSEVGAAALRRVLLPAAILWVTIVGVGFLLVDVVQIDEHAISQAFVELRTPALDSISAVVSEMANTQVIMATTVVVVAIVWWQSRQWWFAVVPATALGVEAAVFLTSSLVVGRERPDVDQLDHAPPTSSFPSGHTGASTAVYVSFALMATRIRIGAVRVTVIVVCALFPVAVALSRVYRGMHHPTDVIAGLAVGTTCALIGWTWLRDDARVASREEVAATA
ncbi:phosphatase PAP2 family protein [Demequina sp. SYSU T00039]|uniref:Phosphatase PAP2 family protein n=1 Tax=Demequina lignilytica TaxID=3051663 RepID=A0AAW7M2Z7_9MICO|nr:MULTISPECIES: phosphatase PAP2 family protein [unclassified Demequina]MDN4477580.1 phosphatase PAP2 family protein [Demequina sp. SYSU T00039-1]MDN4488069.1 phosphatase PAP2 family protein [Demequina sp. SYSU T00039]